MANSILFILSLGLFLQLNSSFASADSATHLKKWKMTTLEWPPFTCEKCPDQGAGIKALKAALKSVGVEVEFVFLPWTRAVKQASDAEFVGGFPFWPEEIPQELTPSSSLFKSPIGFIEPKNKPLIWKKLDDLAGKTIGTVQDYGNTKTFNRLVREGKIKTEIVLNDDINLKKVAAGRIDGMIADLTVAQCYLRTHDKEITDKVHINPKWVENKDLLAAFNKQNINKLLLLEAALKKVNTQEIVNDYLKTMDLKPSQQSH